MNKLIWFYRRIDQNRNAFEFRLPKFAAITSDGVAIPRIRLSPHDSYGMSDRTTHSLCRFPFFLFCPVYLRRVRARACISLTSGSLCTRL